MLFSFTFVLLTDGGFTELLSCHFIGDVGAHENTDINAHLLSNNVRDQLEALRSFIYPLKEKQMDFSEIMFPKKGVLDKLSDVVQFFFVRGI